MIATCFTAIRSQQTRINRSTRGLRGTSLCTLTSSTNAEDSISGGGRAPIRERRFENNMGTAAKKVVPRKKQCRGEGSPVRTRPSESTPPVWFGGADLHGLVVTDNKCGANGAE